MILHVLMYNGVSHDFMVGAQLDGFECMVSLSDEAEIAVLEGDEYLSSPIDLRPKFHLYKPTIGLISGIAWDHINVFPTFENYVDQFRIFANSIDSLGKFIYFTGDESIMSIKNSLNNDLSTFGYATHEHLLIDGTTYLIDGENQYPIQIFGEHNLQNLNGALAVCLELGIGKKQFYKAIQSFTGASKRLELVKENKSSVIYKDFAHSPSKLKATTKALSDQFPKRQLVACMELHTFSSLNLTFLKLYKGTMENADMAFVYYNPDTIKHKKLDSISSDDVLRAFYTDNVRVFTDSSLLVQELKSINWKNKNLLFMSSGNFDGLDFNELSQELIG
jgi:UDP-N-acetylmuramate: L-alanyl-gamma-D-glutamyl-meso-diaminopimelate ligase